MLARLMFAAVNFSARQGLLSDAPEDPAGASSAANREAAKLSEKAAARRTGIRGETYAYWYLRRHGYTMIARNYMFPGVKGEIDMVGYDGETLAFVEVKTRSIPKSGTMPAATAQRSAEDAVTHDKRRNLSRMAKQFLQVRRIDGAAYRFDVVAIENCAGAPPQIRLHKGAFVPEF